MWIILVLLTAFFVSLLEIYSKKAVKGIDIYVVTLSWQLFSLPFLLPLLLKEGIPEVSVTFWKAVATAAVILIVALVLYVKALKARQNQ